MKRKRRTENAPIKTCTRCNCRPAIVQRPDIGSAFCAECLISMERKRQQLEELRAMTPQELFNGK